MAEWEEDCDKCNAIALRPEQDEWWAMFEKHAIDVQPDIDRASLRKAIDDFRAAQQSLGEAIQSYHFGK